MTIRCLWRLRRVLFAAMPLALWVTGAMLVARASAQDIPPPAKLVHVTAAPVEVSAPGSATAHVTLDVATGWHVNSNPASPDYMVPTGIELAGGGGITIGDPHYPAGKPIKLGFEESTISVYGGSATIELPVQVAASATGGAHTLKGTVRFQACNDQLCLAPASVPFSIQVMVRGGASAAGTPETAAAQPESSRASAVPGSSSHLPPAPAPASGSFSTRPPAGGTPAALDNPLARALEHGGFFAFLTLFGIGLALNLTPCVYPMLGVTVSIFGARRAEPPLKVFSNALVYVLGMATMYSVLGVVAAFSGAMFGGWLQNPIVLVAIGALFLALALSMFGVYEFQLPAALRERAGAMQATSWAGLFASGLLVGVIAAPCIGPSVVALLAIVGAKGDPAFGFVSFFTLAIGLGAPYLVLGTFSNLLQTLPRSGDWMEWVKHAFGVILIALGAFYLSLGLAPRLGDWVLPIALVAGGAYLGFIDQHGDRNSRFRLSKRAAGTLAVLGGLAIVAIQPKATVAGERYSSAALDQALASGKTVMIDFSADWCVPCHELEKFTLTDAKVIQEARGFAVFKADLTRYDSPESSHLREKYAIAGVPTIVFLKPDGSEVRESRVEGFLPAEAFLSRMRVAGGS